MFIFEVSLFDPGLLVTDNVNLEYTVWSSEYRFSASISCSRSATSSVRSFTALPFRPSTPRCTMVSVLYILLLNYCLIVSERGFSVKWSNSLKLVSIVIGSLLLCFPSFQVSASQYLLLAFRRLQQTVGLSCTLSSSSSTKSLRPRIVSSALTSSGSSWELRFLTGSSLS